MSIKEHTIACCREPTRGIKSASCDVDGSAFDCVHDNEMMLCNCIKAAAPSTTLISMTCFAHCSLNLEAISEQPVIARSLVLTCSDDSLFASEINAMHAASVEKGSGKAVIITWSASRGRRSVDTSSVTLASARAMRVTNERLKPFDTTAKRGLRSSIE